jgi:hypothetical protein
MRASVLVLARRDTTNCETWISLYSRSLCVSDVSVAFRRDRAAAAGLGFDWLANRPLAGRYVGCRQAIGMLRVDSAAHEALANLGITAYDCHCAISAGDRVISLAFSDLPI